MAINKPNLNIPNLNTNTPELFINKYVWEQFRLADETFYNQYKNNGVSFVPIFPINDPNASNIAWGSRPYILYDNFVKARTGKDKYFYPIKSQQMLYSIRGASVEDVYAMRHIMLSSLDREDAAAEDINNFISITNSDPLKPPLVNFQCINAYQVTYMKDATNLDTTRTPYQTDLIVKFDYHIIPPQIPIVAGTASAGFVSASGYLYY